MDSTVYILHIIISFKLHLQYDKLIMSQLKFMIHEKFRGRRVPHLHKICDVCDTMHVCSKQTVFHPFIQTFYTESFMLFIKLETFSHKTFQLASYTVKL